MARVNTGMSCGVNSVVNGNTTKIECFDFIGSLLQAAMDGVVNGVGVSCGVGGGELYKFLRAWSLVQRESVANML